MASLSKSTTDASVSVCVSIGRPATEQLGMKMTIISTFVGGVLTMTTAAHGQEIAVKDIERNWDSLSHFPDRRATIELGALSERLNRFAAHVSGLIADGGKLDGAAEIEQFAARHISLTRRAWALESRCMSSFVVGPANFPTDRNRKRMNSADSAYRCVSDHLATAMKAASRRAFPYGAPGEAIRSNNPDAPDLLRAEIEERKAAHVRMKAVNAAIRSVKSGNADETIQAVIDATGWREDAARAVVCPPDHMAIYGRRFQTFQLSNTLAEIRRLESRLASIERNRARGEVERTAETAAGDVRIVESGEAARIQLFFEGKPAAEVRDILKHNGFRWAPSEGAWQRHLNEGGRWAADRVLKALQPTAA